MAGGGTIPLSTRLPFVAGRTSARSIDDDGGTTFIISDQRYEAGCDDSRLRKAARWSDREDRGGVETGGNSFAGLIDELHFPPCPGRLGQGESDVSPGSTRRRSPSLGLPRHRTYATPRAMHHIRSRR